MTNSLSDTIAAVATPPGMGGIGIIRISGIDAFKIAEAVFTPVSAAADAEHARLLPGRIVERESGRSLDFVMAVRLYSPRSYTGEDVFEIHGHGGRLNLERILGLVLARGARVANPGEFSLRAFLNGRMDLARAEAVRELIESRTDAALRTSRRHLEGDISDLCESAREACTAALAHLEALVDFPDERLPEGDATEYAEDLAKIAERINEAVQSYERGRLLHEGADTMIIGAPNVGKSSLLNRLLRSERAIVSEEPGTTRDLIEAVVAFAGVPVRFIDSAGLNTEAGGVEAIGVSRAWGRLENADFLLWVLDRSRPVQAQERELAGRLEGRRGIVVLNKLDLPSGCGGEARGLVKSWPLVELSAKTGEGLDRLEAAIRDLLDRPDAESDEPIVTSVRHQATFSASVEAIRRARTGILKGDVPPELIAADLREALDRLGEVVGLTTPDDVLNEIFSKFCIGK